ncbi:MAG: CDP-glucose 4,6-dehydratase [Lachnospiraceae bacterium]|nr:CDP-glucose 4,6-dehydratase [Lachnospiraceae bacterium]
MTDYKKLEEFYKGKRVFLTGHTGFKGSWMCMVLNMLGAEVYGYSLKPNTDPALYDILGIDLHIHSYIGDIRDYSTLSKAYVEADPEIVIHMAAQPIVRDSYKDPAYTYETNVMGTVNILECLRNHPGAVSFLNVTTDKVYENSDKPDHAFKEDEKLDGYDPYSNSKSCSELITHSYRQSFFNVGERQKCGDRPVVPAISTARAGNVIGGGDYATDRIIPDCVRATVKGESIVVRNPYSTRPYQHVLEPTRAYLMIAMAQAFDNSVADSYNIGPDREDCINTGKVADLFVDNWGNDASWKNVGEVNAPHEAAFLMLDNSKAANQLGIRPKWHTDKAIAKTVEWYKAYNEGGDMYSYTISQISDYLDE